MPYLLPVDIPFARGPSTCLRLLGAPIGSPAHSAGALEAVVEVSKQAHLLLTEMDDPQVELLLLRACLGSATMKYLTRVAPQTLSLLLRPPLTIPCGLSWDEFARTTFLTLSGCKPRRPSVLEDLA
jgi:hypothetical protein